MLLWCASLGGNKSYYLSRRSPKADPLDSSPKKLCYYCVMLRGWLRWRRSIRFSFL